MRGTMFLLDKLTARTGVPRLTLMVTAPERIAALLTDERGVPMGALEKGPKTDRPIAALLTD